ncbi:cytochrome P450 [Cellulomonas dongxiuzhuiae]|uniref:cytochrome P450 n=1 Tax=Cellulomonas dongxiuzhuiae TaxID=2819979 RepID=UPI001AB016BE|nr:cytochrome P450 [Cellulomonas dongxiuzhuiae]MBO3089978.1 cytochrome P450 [Cellulomonas dongxiuzhuiae]
MGPRDVVPLGAADTARALGVLAGLVAQGAIRRRPRVTPLADRMHWDDRGVETLRTLADRYDRRPVLLRLGVRDMLVPLHVDDARAVLAASPEPFSPASAEKRGALHHFQPDGVLISPTRRRPPRRAWNEAALDTGRPVHAAAPRFDATVTADAAWIAQRALRHDDIGFDDVDDLLWATVREIALGPGARHDARLTDELLALRGRANWSGVVPVATRRRAAFLQRLHEHVVAAPPNSLAGHGRAAAGDSSAVTSQVAHWLFAFDAARITLWRALAVLAARPALQDDARREQPDADVLPLARAVVDETLRVWPTTLVLLRETTAPTAWGGTTLDPGTGVVLVSSYWHRDPALGPDADAFRPGADRSAGLVVPFSAGPVVCPARDVVLHVTSHLLAALVRAVRWEPVTHPGLGHDPLPGSLAHTTVRVAARP